MICAGAISGARHPILCPHATKAGPARSPPAAGTASIQIHDDDEEDATPSTYEREIDLFDTAKFERICNG